MYTTQSCAKSCSRSQLVIENLSFPRIQYFRNPRFPLHLAGHNGCTLGKPRALPTIGGYVRPRYGPVVRNSSNIAVGCVDRKQLKYPRNDGVVAEKESWKLERQYKPIEETFESHDTVVYRKITGVQVNVPARLRPRNDDIHTGQQLPSKSNDINQRFSHETDDKLDSAIEPSVLQGKSFESSFPPYQNELYSNSSAIKQGYDNVNFGTKVEPEQPELLFEEGDSQSPTVIGKIDLNIVSGCKLSKLTANAMAYSSSGHRKADLSHASVAKREAMAKLGVSSNRGRQTTSFRANRGLRRILAQFIVHVSTRSFKMPDGEYSRAEAIYDSQLLAVFNPMNLQLLSTRGYQPQDVMAWAWILTARSTTEQFRRYVVFCEDCRRCKTSLPPVFVALQLLRGTRSNAASLRSLWQELSNSFRHDILSAWNIDSAAMLLIRMLRHARITDFSLYTDITQATPKILPLRTVVNENKPFTQAHYRKLTHFYNRFLTLIALPIPQHPFRSISIQQESQMIIARYMHHCNPRLLINREGYRALFRLQLRHEKTSEEQEWARVKASSWPPWRKDQLGIHEGIEYPGRRSRVMKVLQRMGKSGYAPTDFEDAAQILSGWDTDRSPTIQVRRIIDSRPMAWLRDLVSIQKGHATSTAHGIWAARVEATRSVREAWLCFFSYLESTSDQCRDMNVYYAMFRKLLANPAKGTTSDRLPGDGSEVYPDPLSTRDLVYVPTDPPTLDKLYTQMLKDDIKPAGRLLARLVKQAPSLKKGLGYINDSSLSEVKRDVLIHAEKYPRAFIRDTSKSLPPYLLSSFIYFLAVKSRPDARIFRLPTSLSLKPEFKFHEYVSSFSYARHLLEISESDHLPAYHGLLSAIRNRTASFAKTHQRNDKLKSDLGRKMWFWMTEVCKMMSCQNIVPDTETLVLTTMIARNLAAEVRDRSSEEGIQLKMMLKVIRSVFTRMIQGQALQGKDLQFYDGNDEPYNTPSGPGSSGLLPRNKDLELLFVTFAMLKSFEDVIWLLQWMTNARQSLTLLEADPGSFRDLLSAVRVAAEQIYAKREGSQGERVPQGMEPEQFQKVFDLCKPFGWVSDDEAMDYVKRKKL